MKVRLEPRMVATSVQRRADGRRRGGNEKTGDAASRERISSDYRSGVILAQRILDPWPGWQPHHRLGIGNGYGFGPIVPPASSGERWTALSISRAQIGATPWVAMETRTSAEGSGSATSRSYGRGISGDESRKSAVARLQAMGTL